MKTKFNLKTIALLIFAVLFNQSLVKAQIICYDFVPDSVILNTGTAQYDTDLDIDGDSNFDFRFRSVSSGGLGFVQLSGNTYLTNFALTNGSNDLLALNAGATIDASSTTWTQLNSTNQSVANYFGSASGPFAGQNNKYVGIRFITGSNTYYGWVELSASGTAINSYTIHRFAYNSVANQGILAGQGCSASFTMPSSICIGGSVSVSSSTTASTYTWSSNPAGALIATPNASATAITFTTATVYTITLATTTGTNNTNAANTITVHPLPTLSITSSHSVLCSNLSQTATISASGAANYTWNPGSTTGSSISVSPSVTTVYTITGTSSAGCTNTITFTQSVTVCSGITQVGINSESFSVYPNPANEKIYIHSNTVKSLNITIQLMDAMGKLILSEKQNYSANISSRAIDISHLPNAIYFVKVISAEGDTKLIKVVKN